VTSTRAQSYQRCPFAPGPAEIRCQARAGRPAASSAARRLPVPAVTGWVFATASTYPMRRVCRSARSPGSAPTPRRRPPTGPVCRRPGRGDHRPGQRRLGGELHPGGHRGLPPPRHILRPAPCSAIVQQSRGSPASRPSTNRPHPPTRLHPGEPAGDPAHHLIEATRPPGRVYAGGRVAVPVGMWCSWTWRRSSVPVKMMRTARGRVQLRRVWRALSPRAGSLRRCRRGSRRRCRCARRIPARPGTRGAANPGS
jgi:hypothetical protein